MAGGREEIRYPCPSQARFQSKACRKRFLHYYWYVLDPVMGPMSVRVASYFPFNVACYLNGHSFVAQERARALFRYEKELRGYARLDFRRATAD